MNFQRPEGYKEFTRTPMVIVLTILYLILMCSVFLLIPQLRDRIGLLIPLGFGGHQLMLFLWFYRKTGQVYTTQLAISLIALAFGFGLLIHRTGFIAGIV